MISRHPLSTRRLSRTIAHFGVVAVCLFTQAVRTNAGESLTLAGVHVIPHRQSQEMRYRKETDFSLGARVEIFLRNEGQNQLEVPNTTLARLRGKTPTELLASDKWAWHDFPPAWGGTPLKLPPNALTVWSWNGKREDWGVNTKTDLKITIPNGVDPAPLTIPIEAPKAWVSALTFLGSDENPYPDSMVFHIANETESPLRIKASRLWLPVSNSSWRALLPQPWQTDALQRFPSDRTIPTQDRGGARVSTGRLPLTYAALEVQLENSDNEIITVWAHQRIKREIFDIGGGWVASKLASGNSLHAEPYLRTLHRMHINSGMHQEVSGYSDTELYSKYPLKYMNRLQPTMHYDTDDVLPRIHAVEFLGEPQYGGGRPVPPQEVWQAFAPYAPTRLPTSVTHSEERIWRWYAGLSDYPHYDAYRVNAPAADSWSRYDRWEGNRIRWGAPLEGIGTMTRSLRELNRPRPIAYWSQGANRWGRYGGRSRRAPTPDELRAQAYQGLAGRITSLYWFNLSLKSLVAFRDLIDPITRINRESLMLANLVLEGDAYEYRRVQRNGKPDWDLSSITGPRGGVFFANDLAYQPDKDDKVFVFARRQGTFTFQLPHYLRRPAEVFRLDANGTHDVRYQLQDASFQIIDRVHAAGIYIVSPMEGLRAELQEIHQELVAHEQVIEFDPAHDDTDFATLEGLLRSPPQ